MSKRIGLTACALTAALGLLLAAGCAHPCGYVEIRTRLAPIGDEREVERLPAVRPLRILRDVSATNAVIEVQVEEREVTTGLAVQETHGRRTYVPYKWYAPILKPLASVTVVLPFYFSASSPHSHGAGNWGMLDYFRDVLAWFNPFSALPAGSRRVESRERPLRWRVISAPLAERQVPISGRAVALHLDGEKIEEQVSDAEGMVRFDLTQRLTSEFAQDDRQLALVSSAPDGAVEDMRWTVTADVLRELVRQRESEAAAAE